MICPSCGYVSSTLDCRNCFAPLHMTGQDVQPVGYLSGPQDIQDKKNILLPQFQNTDSVVSRTLTIPDATRLGWQKFRDEFYAFYKESNSILFPEAIAGDMDKLESYQNQLHSWQVELKKYAPQINVTEQTKGNVLDRVSDAFDKWSDTTKTIAVVGGFMVGGFLLASLFVAYKMATNPEVQSFAKERLKEQDERARMALQAATRFV